MHPLRHRRIMKATTAAWHLTQARTLTMQRKAQGLGSLRVWRVWSDAHAHELSLHPVEPEGLRSLKGGPMDMSVCKTPDPKVLNTSGLKF